MASGIVEPSSQDSSQEGEKQQQGHRAGERSRLVQRLLDGGSDLPAFLNDLLATMALNVAGTEAALFAIERNDQQLALKVMHHIRQDDSDAQMRSAALEAFQNLVKPCILQGKDGAIDLGNATPTDAEPQYCLITLLREGPNIVAVAAVITRCLNLERARQRLLSMQLVAGYFEFFHLKRGAENNRQMALNHQRVLQLSRAVADAEGFLSAAMNLCNELATATGATRVSLGWRKGRVVKVKALSHTEEFDKKQELIVQLEKVMEECFDQETQVLFDPTGKTGGDAVNRQAAALSRSQGGHTVLSLPLRRRAEIEGVITLEFLTAEVLNPKIVEGLSISVDLLAPQLFDRHENDRWWITKTGLSMQHTAEELLGPKHWIAKLVTTGVILLLLFLTNVFGLFNNTWLDMRPMYHVTASIAFDSLERRSLCAPFDGQIDQVWVRPGEMVKAGTPLFSLNTDDLVKQKSKSDSEALYHMRRAQAYAADPTKTADGLAEAAQQEEAQATSDLLASQIKRATIVAPFDGQVLKGDLWDQKDVPVKEGEEKMVFGDPSALRAALTVDERDIQDVHEGSRGTLATTSKPLDKVGFTVSRVDPQGTPKEGKNVFTVYGRLDKVDSSWRPGMAGEARVNVEKRTWAWIWTHRLMEFVRLKTWM